MYIKKVTIEGIKCFREKVKFDFTQNGKPAMWNVIVSNNGGGKTTILQSIALTMMGNSGIDGLEKLFMEYDSGIAPTEKIIKDRIQLKKITEDASEIVISELAKAREEIIPDKHIPGTYLGLAEWISMDKPNSKVVITFGNRTKAMTTLFRTNKRQRRFDQVDQSRLRIKHQSTFSKENNFVLAGYGTIRRIMTVNELFDQHYERGRPGHNFGSLFHHRIPLFLSEILTDIPLEIKNFVAGKIFPDDVRFVRKESDSNGDIFHVDHVLTADGYIPSWDMSDGYRTAMALSGDILANIAGDDPKKIIFSGTQIKNEGIVLIDEIDTSLHPKWQQKIGAILTDIFPRIQFIVTTHSPFISQVVGEYGSTIHKLERNEKDRTTVMAIKMNEPYHLLESDQILIDLFKLQTTSSWKLEENINKYHEFFANRNFDNEFYELENQLRRDLGIRDQEMERIDRIRELLQELAVLWHWEE